MARTSYTEPSSFLDAVRVASNQLVCPGATALLGPNDTVPRSDSHERAARGCERLSIS